MCSFRAIGIFASARSSTRLLALVCTVCVPPWLETRKLQAVPEVLIDSIQEVFIARLPDSPGKLGSYLARLSASGVEVNGAYFLGDDRGRGGVVLTLNDMDKAETVNI